MSACFFLRHHALWGDYWDDPYMLGIMPCRRISAVLRCNDNYMSFLFGLAIRTGRVSGCCAILGIDKPVLLQRVHWPHQQIYF